MLFLVAAFLTSAERSLPSAPIVPPMSIKVYLQQWDTLTPSDSQSGGSKKAQLLVDEILASGKAYKDEVANERASGVKPRGCPPEHFTMTADDIIPRLRAMSPDEQAQDIKLGVFKIFDEQYACN